MSVSSRFSNWLSPNNTDAGTLQASSNDDFAAAAAAEHDIDSTRQIKRQRTMEPTAEDDGDIEFKRPPYLHVCRGRMGSWK
jgi:hypothetical protein